MIELVLSGTDASILSLISIVFTILSLILLFIFGLRLRKWKKTYIRMMKGKESRNLEELILEVREKIAEQDDRLASNQEQMSKLLQAIRTMKNKMGIIRYPAFSGEGSDLSFSVALIDEEKNGVVITALHTRNESYVYAKPIKEGTSDYPLTPEEKEAINRASAF
jgi:hypothetical protein